MFCIAVIGNFSLTWFFPRLKLNKVWNSSQHRIPLSTHVGANYNKHPGQGRGKVSKTLKQVK